MSLACAWQGSVFVNTLPGHTSILLRDREALNRSMDGDIVVVRLLPPSEWKRDGERRLADRSTTKDDMDDDADERAAGAMPFAADFDTAVETGWMDDPAAAGAATDPTPAGGAETSGATSGTASGRPCGVVVGIIKRGWRPYVCVLDPESSMGGQFLVEPLEQKIPKINIVRRTPPPPAGDH